MLPKEVYQHLIVALAEIHNQPSTSAREKEALQHRIQVLASKIKGMK